MYMSVESTAGRREREMTKTTTGIPEERSRTVPKHIQFSMGYLARNLCVE